MDKNLNNEIPENVRLKLDDTYKQILESEKYSKKSIKKVTKVATIAATITTLTLSTGFALEYMIEYFKVNQGSKYISTQEGVNSLNKVVNKSVTDKNIEFTVDSVAADDNYINIFYTIKSDKNIKEIEEWYEDPLFAKPHMMLLANGEELYETTMIEGEASYISDTELKGIRRLNITHYDIPNKFNLDINIDEIFTQEGNWKIAMEIDKTEAVKNSKKYNINKDFIVRKRYEDNKETITVDHEVNIDKVVISPLGNQIVVKENIKEIKPEWSPYIGYQFALFDQDGHQLDTIDKGAVENPGITVNSYEFINTNKELTSLKYVPIQYNEDVEDKRLGAKSIDSLPIEFKVSKNGKWVIDKIDIKDSEILIHARKEGFVYNGLLASLIYCDENGEQIEFDVESSPLSDVANDRNNKNQIYSIKFSEKFKDGINRIKSIDMDSEERIELSIDQAVEIDLTK
ncbi:MAG: DUF4179 domain-containing protein [Peptostreptococcaceae bacterium]